MKYYIKKFQNPFEKLNIQIEKPVESIRSDYFPKTISDAEKILAEEEGKKKTWSPREITPVNRDLNKVLKTGVEKYKKVLDQEYLKSLSSSELKKLQKQLADAGYYDEYIRDIKGTQARLIELGLLDNTLNEDGTFKEVDGKLGPKTRRAFRQAQVDGILGNLTKKAFEKFKKDQEKNRDIPGFTVPKHCTASGCANYVGQIIDEFTPYSHRDGFTGHAWTMFGNLQDAGGDIYYNMYTPDIKGLKSNLQEYDKAVLANARKNPIPISEMKVGDIVGLHWGGSNYFDDAVKDGNITHNNHIGIVSEIRNGIPYIAHTTNYIHSRVEPYDKTGYTITALGRVGNLANMKVPISIKENPSFDIEGGNKDVTSFIKGMDSIERLLKSTFPNIDYDTLKKAAVAIQKRETNLFTNRKSQQTGINYLTNEAGNLVKKWKGIPSSSISTDFAKIKPGSFSTAEKTMLGITSTNSLNDPTIAGRAALYLLARNYSYFQNLQKQIPELTDEDILNATILSYNQGMGKLKHIGYDHKTNQFNQDEIDALRTISNSDLIKDVSSTNYKYLPIIGEQLYDTFVDGHVPYVKSARNFMKNTKYIK